VLHRAVAHPGGGLGREQLSARDLARRIAAAVDGSRGLVDKALRRAQARVHVRHVEGEGLIGRERLAELLPRLEVRDRFVERAPAHADRGGRHGRAEASEHAERDLESAAFGADPVLIGNGGVGEAHVADRMRAEHLEARRRHAARVRRHVEHRQRAAISGARLSDFARRAREQRVEVRDARVGDESLVSVEAPTGRGAHRARRDVAEARAGAGLGEREARDALAVHDTPQHVAAQGAVVARRERIGTQSLHHEHHVEHRAVIRELAAQRAERSHRDGARRRESARIRAAVRSRDAPREQARFRERRERAFRGLRLVELRELGGELATDTIRGRRQAVELRAVAGVHISRSALPRRAW
jgi:hypothetical protein